MLSRLWNYWLPYCVNGSAKLPSNKRRKDDVLSVEACQFHPGASQRIEVDEAGAQPEKFIKYLLALMKMKRKLINGLKTLRQNSILLLYNSLQIIKQKTHSLSGFFIIKIISFTQRNLQLLSLLSQLPLLALDKSFQFVFYQKFEKLTLMLFHQ